MAEEMGEDVVGTDELEAPVKRVEDVGLLVNELIIRERGFDIFKQLCNTWIRLLMVLGGDENACDGN